MNFVVNLGKTQLPGHPSQHPASAPMTLQQYIS